MQSDRGTNRMVLMCEFREVNLQFNSKGTCNANTNPILRWEFENLQHKPQLKGHADYETVIRKAIQGALRIKNLTLNLNLTGHKAIQEVLQAQNEDRQKVERKRSSPNEPPLILTITLTLKGRERRWSPEYVHQS